MFLSHPKRVSCLRSIKTYFISNELMKITSMTFWIPEMELSQHVINVKLVEELDRDLLEPLTVDGRVG